MGNKIKNFFIGIWERINQIDVPDGVEDLTSAEKKELDAINQAQGDVHEQRSFAERVKVSKKDKDKVDPLIAKYGEAKPGNPIYDLGQSMKERDERGE